MRTFPAAIALPPSQTPFPRPGEGRARWRFASLTLALCCLPLFGLTADTNRDGTLKAFENELKDRDESPPPSEPPAKHKRARPRSDSSPCEESTEGFLDALMMDLVVEPLFHYVVGSPFTVPYHLLGDDYRQKKGPVPPYPFGPAVSPGRRWRASLRTAHQWSPGALTGHRVEGSLFFLERFGLEGATSRYVEKRPDGRYRLTANEVLGTFVFARSPALEFRAGLGYQRLDGERRHEGGKAVYRVRYSRKPISVDLDFGASLGMGNHALWEVRPALNGHWNRAAISLGYRHWRAGDTKIQGPELGLSVFF